MRTQLFFRSSFAVGTAFHPSGRAPVRFSASVPAGVDFLMYDALKLKARGPSAKGGSTVGGKGGSPSADCRCSRSSAKDSMSALRLSIWLWNALSPKGLPLMP